ncbi:hypothetical protein HDU83_003564 [Entophlyctis luteolus]|nr:hypothetical protein HDU83_003564 [Entophlyctis luteolus]
MRSSSVSLSRRPLVSGDTSLIEALEAKANAVAAKYAALSSSSSDRVVSRRAYVTNVQGSALFTNVSVGSNNQNFFVDVDTGSAVFWIPVKGCSQCPPSGNFFNTATSSSYSVIDSTTVEEDYGSGAVEGYFASDTTTWAGLTAKSQPILMVTAEDSTMLSEMETEGGDGILGLAYDGGLISPGISSTESTTILANLASQGLLTNSYFCLWFNQSSVITNTKLNDPNGGVISFGTADTTLYTGSFSFVPVVSTPITVSSGTSETITFYWAVDASSVSIGTRALTIPSSLQVIVDSGTTLLALDSSTLSQVVTQLKTVTTVRSTTSGLYVVSCSQVSSLPTFSFTLGSSSFSLSPSDYIVTDDQYCILGMMSLPTGQQSNLWIFGDIFMRKYFTVFDFGNKQVGFAVASDGLTSGNGVALTSSILAAGMSSSASSTASSTKTSDASARNVGVSLLGVAVVLACMLVW